MDVIYEFICYVWTYPPNNLTLFFMYQ
jgi:hypothetical protein